MLRQVIYQVFAEYKGDSQISSENVGDDSTCCFNEKSLYKYGPGNTSFPRYRVLMLQGKNYYFS